MPKLKARVALRSEFDQNFFADEFHRNFGVGKLKVRFKHS